MRQLVTSCTLLLTISLLPGWAQQDVITTAIGGGPNDIPALQADINGPTGLALDASGNYYFAAFGANRVYKVDTNGILTVVAGTGVAGYAGDGVAGGASNALLSGPLGVAVDSIGNIYVADYNNNVLRKIDTTNTIATVAGVHGQCNYNGDGTPATSFHLCDPEGVAVDTSGDVYIGDTGNCRVRKLVPSTNTISTIAGTGTCSYSGDGGLATSAELHDPVGLAVDNSGDVFIADYDNFRIREVASATGFITTVAGDGTDGFKGDGGPATSAEIGYVREGVAVNSAGTTVTISDYSNNRVRQFTVGGDINTIAGTGSASFCGDGGPATSACLDGPRGLAISGSGSIYLADYSNNRIREFTIGGNIGTVAGNGSTKFPTLVSGFPPSGVVLNNPVDVLEDPSGNVFISEYTNCIVRELVKATGLVNVFAGTVATATNATTGTCGFNIGPGPATSAELGNVSGLARDSAGNLYIADQLNCVVWEVSAATEDISIFAGTPKECGYSGDGGAATSAQLNVPAGLFVDSKNNFYIGDYSNNRIREVTNGIISTIAGNGTAGFLGDGDPATIAELNHPIGVVVDSAGDAFIADKDNCVIREVTAATNIINTIAGEPTSCGYNGDGAATEHQLNDPSRLHLDANGNLFISDYSNQRVRWLSPEGVLTTIAGNGTAGLSGDGGPALAAELNGPLGIAQDAMGDFLVADYDNLRIREVPVFSALNTSPASLDFGIVTVGAASTPQTITLSALGPLTLSNISITGPFTEYDDCGTGLANAATCTMYVYFKPTTARAKTGTISIEDNGFFTDTTTISLAGTGSAISVTGGPLLFGNQAVKTNSAVQTVTLANNSAASITMGTVTLNETDFAIASNKCPASGSPLAANATCTISIVFRPKTTGAKKGALIIQDSDPSSPQIVGMSGTGTSLVVLTPSSLTFGAQAVGTTSGLAKITLTNNTGVALTLSSPAVTATAPFAIGTGPTSCSNSQVVAAGQTCFIYVNFTPTSVGYPTGTLSVFDSDSTSPQTVPLSGSGTGVEFTPSSITFATSSVGHQVSAAVSITNVGTSTITFTAATITGPNAGDFSTNNGDPPCKGSIAPGGLCSFTAYFTPSIVGTEAATYVVYDNSTGGTQSLPLTGTGQ